jgi:hypothetical protein
MDCDTTKTETKTWNWTKAAQRREVPKFIKENPMIANALESGRVMQGVTPNTPLPPSVEAAYYRKCIELKRRINEIEESNDVIRTRKARVERAVLKLRLERTFLLEQLQKRMDRNVDESDESDSPPPTVRLELGSVSPVHINGFLEAPPPLVLFQLKALFSQSRRQTAYTLTSLPKNRCG